MGSSSGQLTCENVEISVQSVGLEMLAIDPGLDSTTSCARHFAIEQEQLLALPGRAAPFIEAALVDVVASNPLRVRPRLEHEANGPAKAQGYAGPSTKPTGGISFGAYRDFKRGRHLDAVTPNKAIAGG